MTHYINVSNDFRGQKRVNRLKINSGLLFRKIALIEMLGWGVG